MGGCGFLPQDSGRRGASSGNFRCERVARFVRILLLTTFIAPTSRIRRIPAKRSAWLAAFFLSSLPNPTRWYCSIVGPFGHPLNICHSSSDSEKLLGSIAHLSRPPGTSPPQSMRTTQSPSSRLPSSSFGTATAFHLRAGMRSIFRTMNPASSPAETPPSRSPSGLV